MVLVVAIRYSYSKLALIESVMGLLILVGIVVFLRASQRWQATQKYIGMPQRAALSGIALGGLWLVEISINNFIAPPLPGRDIIDNIFWAVIACSILALATGSAFRTQSILQGIKSGAWSGLASGLLACCTALSIITFAMAFILRDPLNITEWAARQAESAAPSMAAYFAYETFAGAFLHLIVLGIGMGGLLGILGGITGKCASCASVFFGRNKGAAQIEKPG